MCRQVHNESKSFAALPCTTLVLNGSSFYTGISQLDLWHRHHLSHVKSVQLGHDMVRSIETCGKHVNRPIGTARYLELLIPVRELFPALELVLLPKSLEIKSDYYNATVGFFFLRPGVSIAYR